MMVGEMKGGCGNREIVDGCCGGGGEHREGGIGKGFSSTFFLKKRKVDEKIGTIMMTKQTRWFRCQYWPKIKSHVV